MNNDESQPNKDPNKKPFVIKMRWIVIAVLAYMLIFNYLLYRGTQSEEPQQQQNFTD